MTTNAQHTPLLAAYNLRLDAKAFRENTVYDSEGDPIRLIANAQRMEAGADAIEALIDALERSQLALTVLANMLKRIDCKKGEAVAVETHRHNAAILERTAR